MIVSTRRMLDLVIEDHRIEVPLVHGDASDPRTIQIHASVVSAKRGSTLPYLLFLQGGPGVEAPFAMRAPSSPSWLSSALRHYRVVMLDQRGTGRSSPIGDHHLELGTDALVEYLTHFRADSIVGDSELLRRELGAQSWSVLGQSFGGFTILAYLSRAAESIDQVLITGGLSAVGRTPDDVYRLTYDKMRDASTRYYRRFPEHRSAVERLVELAEAGSLVLPDQEVVSVSRLRSIGLLLGSDDAWHKLWQLLELPPQSNAFSYDLAAALPYRGRNPLYYVLHESSYADGEVTNWAADRVEPPDFRADPTLLTGEHVRADWSRTVPAFRPWGEVAAKLARIEWPKLYDAQAIEASNVSGAAAVYFNDLFVPVEYAMETAKLLPNVTAWVMSDHEHSGLRTGDVLTRLIDLASDRAIR